jgi:hypothetical protein
MSIDTWSMNLPGSLTQVRPKLECSKCGQSRSAHGGVQVSPTRWHCAACWRGTLATTRNQGGAINNNQAAALQTNR